MTEKPWEEFEGKLVDGYKADLDAARADNGRLMEQNTMLTSALKQSQSEVAAWTRRFDKMLLILSRYD